MGPLNWWIWRSKKTPAILTSKPFFFAGSGDTEWTIILESIFKLSKISKVAKMINLYSLVILRNSFSFWSLTCNSRGHTVLLIRFRNPANHQPVEVGSLSYPIIYHGFYTLIWVFPKIGIPQNGWYIMEAPIKMDHFGVPPFFGNSQIW